MRLNPRLSRQQIQELEEYRKKTKDIAEYKRIQAIMLLDKRYEVELLKEMTGFSRSQIFQLRTIYLAQGIAGIQTKRKGEPKRLLSRRQLQEVINLVKITNPQDHGYQSPFWTTGILANIVWEKYRVKYRSRTSYYVIFRESKFTYHKPGRVSVKRDEEAVQKWREEARQVIKRAWEDPHTIILTEDEVILSTTTTFQRIWLPEGEYPKVEMSTVRKNRSIYGFLNIKTGKHHAYSYERQNMHITVKALQKIRRVYPKKSNKVNKLPGYKILLCWDNVGWHKGSAVQEYIKRDGAIEQVWFPPYSPEENPEEHVWKKTKEEKIHNRLMENIDDITKEIVTYLNSTNFCYSLLGCGHKHQSPLS